MKKAFTLAEVIITMGIVGVVVAMTIPNFVATYTDKIYTQDFKKAYHTISQAWMRTVIDNPDIFVSKGGWSCSWPDGTSGDFSPADGRIDAVKKYMKVAKDCINSTECLNPDDYEWAPEIGRGGDGDLRRFGWITTDGMCWAVPWYHFDDTTIVVDTNCGEKPNKIGYDVYGFLLGKDGIVYFTLDSRKTNDAPVSRGFVCPYAESDIMKSRLLK